MKTAGNLGPALTHLSDHALDGDAFLWGDGRKIQRWLEILVIPLTALLWRAILHNFGDADPVVGSMVVNE